MKSLSFDQMSRVEGGYDQRRCNLALRLQQIAMITGNAAMLSYSFQLARLYCYSENT